MKVHPSARRPGLGALAPDGALRVAVTDPPEDGRANRAVCAMVAKALGVAPSAIEVTRGASARLKTLRIAGDPARLSETLRQLIA